MACDRCCRKILGIILPAICLFLFISPSFAQSNQTVTNGGTVAAISFTGASCTYTWTNDNPSIGLPTSGTGNIASFTAINNGNSPITAKITATPSGGFAYIANSGDGTLSIINVATNTVVSKITPPNDPFSACISPDGSRGYIGCGGGSSTVAIINTATNTLISTINVGATGYSTSVAVTPDGKFLYVTNNVANTVSVVNLISNAVIAVIPVGAYPFGVAISRDGTKAYVGYTFNNYLSVISTVSNTIVSTINLSSPAQYLAISPDGSKLYAPAGTNLTVINPATNAITAVVPTGINTGTLNFNADGTRAYIAAGANKVLVINAATNSVLTTVTVGTNPNGISVSPDKGFVYVSNSGSNNVSVIDPSTNSVITTISVGSIPLSHGNFITAGAGCAPLPVTFTITVNPTSKITVSQALGYNIACSGSASVSPNIQQFFVSGDNLTSNIRAQAPAGFEIGFNLSTAYSDNLVIPQTNGVLKNTVIFVRSAASATIGNILGDVTLSSTGVADRKVAVFGVMYALPTVNKPNSQTVLNGEMVAATNFTGAASAYSWTNDSPGIGLPASGTGNIPAFPAINNGLTAIIATITVAPLNIASCSGTPAKFTITVNPTAKINASNASGNISSCLGTASVSPYVQQFSISGNNLTGNITADAPTGFELSLNTSTGYSNNIVIPQGNGAVNNIVIYIRSSASASAGDISGNVILRSIGAADQVVAATGKVYAVPIVNKPNSQAVLSGTMTAATNFTGTASSYSWTNDTPGIGLTASGTEDIPAFNAINNTLAPVSATITVTPLNGSGCEGVPDKFTIVVNPIPVLPAPIIPNGFTPNDDGINDTWVIKGLQYYNGLTLNIFNRLGEKIFSSIGYLTSWDGKYKGKIVPSGIYYYVIDKKNGDAPLSGWIAVIR
jgi:gliding motility-associated-like protein